MSKPGTFASVWELVAAHEAGTRKHPRAMSGRHVVNNENICFSLLSRVSSGQRHPSQVLLGDDLCLRAFGEPGGLRRPGQHVLHLQPQGQRWERQGHARAGSTHRWVQVS